MILSERYCAFIIVLNQLSEVKSVRIPTFSQKIDS